MKTTRASRILGSSALSAVALASGLAVGLISAPGPVQAQSLLFWSTQAKPVEEAQAMRDEVLSDFERPVEYRSLDAGPFFTRIQAELESGTGTIDLIGGIHGELSGIADGLTDLSGVMGMLDGVTVSQTLMDLGKFNGGEQKYLPWMQASYVMAANRKALEYLPEGADLNALTYDQLIAWAQRLDEETGSPKFGLPAGPQGLIHRFFQGYLYPSFTDSVVTGFRSPAAGEMWADFKTLWAATNPASTNYGFMQEPLLTEEVWVAWDHTARLQDALNQRPDDFVLFPAPAGPAGRGFMPVVAGLAIPETAPDREASEALAAYMMQPETQVKTLLATNFFPVVEVDLPSDLPASVRLSADAIAAQSGAPDANPSLLPVGLGALDGRFNKVFTDTFQRIVLAGHDIGEVLDQQGRTLQSIMEEAGAPCWAPDEPSEGACPVE